MVLAKIRVSSSGNNRLSPRVLIIDRIPWDALEKDLIQQSILYPRMVYSSFTCQQASKQHNLKASLLTYLLGLDCVVNPTLFWPGTRFYLLLIALAVDFHGIDLDQGLNSQRDETGRLFCQAIHERAKTRHYGGKLIKTMRQRNLVEHLWKGNKIPALTSAQWTEARTLRTRHTKNRQTKLAAGAWSDEPETAYDMIMKLVSLDDKYSFADDVITSRPAFQPPSSRCSAQPSSCVYFLQDRDLGILMGKLSTEEGMMAAFRGVERLGFLDVVRDLRLWKG